MEKILNLTSSRPELKSVLGWMADDGRTLLAEGLRGSGTSLFLASLYRLSHARIFVVMEDGEAASYAYNDLATLIDRRHMAVLPSAYRKSPRHGETDIAQEILRTDALNIITTRDRYLIFASTEGIAEYAASASTLRASRVVIRRGQRMEPDELTSKLDSYGFTEVEFVYQPGQYSVRGSIIDVFSYTNELPYRIDFFGTEVETIRTFDIQKQLSEEQVERVDIMPDTRARAAGTRLVPVLDLLDPSVIIVYQNYNNTLARIGSIHDDSMEGDNITISAERFAGLAAGRRTILLRPASRFDGSSSATVISFDQTAQPLFHKDFDLISDTLRQYQARGYKLYICSDSVKQTDRIRSIFDSRGDNIVFTPISKTVHEGYVDNTGQYLVYTDHQIFDRFHRFTLRSDIARQGRAAEALKEINELQIGDYVVHADHGIGRFGGLVVLDDNGRRHETIKIVYKDNDTIYVPIHGLHKVSKYKGRDGEPPRINRLGSGSWDRLKQRAKSKLKELARDLIALYARRAAETGFAFASDDYMQHELEASFLYEDTPDQAAATRDIKADMESKRPMDRLVCGDVGFGKTELAIRAAFKAVLSGKQVAVLVPTTVLALQHYKTFSERLSRFPVRVEYLSRAKRPAEVRAIREALAQGRIDILIGTHKIVGRDIRFADLGLLIIDEEQKFGVAVKEKLRQIKVNIDTLTLTATPIPRTLQFSLMGARDLSILNTAPPNRYPVLTEVSVWDETLIADAIRSEMSRNGQTFVINTRVQNIETIANRIRSIVPEARIAIAHGQMPTDELEQTILDFIEYDYDVLVCTTVVESGIDIPNVNTMIINNAHMFGLADLHQLRGRVGRSNKKAYCYLIAPELALLTEDARRRLRAIETYADLGSGFNIAMQDLDTRGAGNILGAEQSGFITDLGYDTYQQILNEALAELRQESGVEMPATAASVNDCQVDSDLELLLPDDYVSSQTERVVLYRELDSIRTEAQLELFREQLVDRFGAVPASADGLFDMVRLRWRASQLGLTKVVLRAGRMSCHLAEEGSSWYDSSHFISLLDYLKSHPRTSRIEQRAGHGVFIVDRVLSPSAAIDVLRLLA